ncbi:MAG: MarR family transcriptional regulator [Nanoarchaeota archaeon]|nr:MarR family transcriptional regulator [Nanoarchaeota archaeon]
MELKNWLSSGKYRIEVLKILGRKPSIPSDIAKELQIHRSSITRILNDLVDEEIISRTNKSAKTTTYFLTKKGENTVKEIGEEK